MACTLPVVFITVVIVCSCLTAVDDTGLLCCMQADVSLNCSG